MTHPYQKMRQDESWEIAKDIIDRINFWVGREIKLRGKMSYKKENELDKELRGQMIKEITNNLDVLNSV